MSGRPNGTGCSAAFDSNWITPLGPDVDAFEAELAEFCGAPAAAALSSGTAALHLALLLHGIGPGDEVIVPTLTFVAPANAVRYVGADLRFVDCERETWNLDPVLLDAALAPGRRGGPPSRGGDRGGPVRTVRPAGPHHARSATATGSCSSRTRRRPWEPPGRVATPAPGADWVRSRSTGTRSSRPEAAGCSSATRTRSTVPATWRRRPVEPVLHYEHTEVGYNYRLSNLLAGVGRAQLARAPAQIDRRHAINERYRAGLADEPGLGFMPWDRRGRPNGWLTVVLLDDDFGATPLEVCTAPRRPATSRPVRRGSRCTCSPCSPTVPCDRW